MSIEKEAFRIELLRPESTAEKSKTLLGGCADRSIGDVQKPVDDHSCNSNVEPDGVGPLGDCTVLPEAAAESKRQRNENQWQTDDRQDRVRNQNRKVHGANPALPAESNQSSVKVEVEVEAKKDRGTDEGAQHAEFVREDLAAKDEAEADYEEDGCGPVEDRVQGRYG